MQALEHLGSTSNAAALLNAEPDLWDGDTCEAALTRLGELFPAKQPIDLLLAKPSLLHCAVDLRGQSRGDRDPDK